MSEDFEDWMRLGIERGYCGPPCCSTHDGIPSTAEEDQQFDEGFDPCIHVIRPYEDDEMKAAVETNHSPSTWRDFYTTNVGHVVPEADHPVACKTEPS